MDEFKKRVLSLLNEDARYSAKEIGVMLGKSEKDVAAAIKELEAEGVIVKYTAVVNTERTGEDYVDALIEVKVTPQPRSGFDAIAEESVQPVPWVLGLSILLPLNHCVSLPLQRRSFASFML